VPVEYQRYLIIHYKKTHKSARKTLDSGEKHLHHGFFILGHSFLTFCVTSGDWFFS